MRPRHVLTILILTVPACARLKPQPTLPAAPPAATAGCTHIPPRPKPGKPPKPPASDFPQILQPGYWSWDSFTYSWVPPRWKIVVGGDKPVWKDSAWLRDKGACVWVPAHWVIPPVQLNR
jgi:hypothetical protein